MVRIDKYKILGTNVTKFAAWEPTTFDQNNSFSHSTITHIDGICYGQIGTRRLDAETNKIPVGRERSTAVYKHYADQYEEAYNLIIAQYPEAASGKRDMGEIEIYT